MTMLHRPRFNPKMVTLLAVMLLLLIGGGIWWWQQNQRVVPAPDTVPEPTPTPSIDVPAIIGPVTEPPTPIVDTYPPETPTPESPVPEPPTPEPPTLEPPTPTYVQPTPVPTPVIDGLSVRVGYASDRSLLDVQIKQIDNGRAQLTNAANPGSDVRYLINRQRPWLDSLENGLYSGYRVYTIQAVRPDFGRPEIEWLRPGVSFAQTTFTLS